MHHKLFFTVTSQEPVGRSCSKKKIALAKRVSTTIRAKNILKLKSYLALTWVAQIALKASKFALCKLKRRKHKTYSYEIQYQSNSRRATA
jgi:hypothetical protein